MNYLGIDFGKKKIGIAIAMQGILATKLSILLNDKNFFPKLTKMLAEHEITSVVVGIPISMNGKISESTDSALEFVSVIRNKFPDKKIFTYDERLTTKEARKNLPSRSLDDAEAARIILQGFLDKQKNTQNIP